MSEKKFVVTLDGPGIEHFGADDFERVLKDYAFSAEVVVVEIEQPQPDITTTILKKQTKIGEQLVCENLKKHGL